MDGFAGNVEVITDSGTRAGVTGVQWTSEIVPVVVTALYGVTDLAPVAPEMQQSTGRLPEAQWDGTDANGMALTVMLWRQRPDDLAPPPDDQEV